MTLTYKYSHNGNVRPPASCFGKAPDEKLIFKEWWPYTVEPPKKGHFGNGTFVLSSEVVLISEVHVNFITWGGI